MAFLRILATGLVLMVAPAAAADRSSPPAGGAVEAADPDDAYGFLDGTDVGEAGDRGIVLESTPRFGKAEPYLGVNTKLEFGWTPVERLQVTFAVWSAYHRARSGPVLGLPDLDRLAFDGLSTQVRYQLRERGAAPLDPGFTVSLELAWSRYSEEMGVSAERLAATLILAADAALVGDRLYGAVNLSLGPGMERPRGLPGYRNDSGLEIGGALAYRLAEGGSTFVGGNVRYAVASGGAFLDGWAGHALFVGPTFFHRLGDIGPFKEGFVSLAWSAQVWGRAGGGVTGGLDLVNFERHQLRVKFGASF